MPKQRTEWGVGDPIISVVGDHFCNPYPMELVVKRKMSLLNTHFDVYDHTGNLLLQVDGSIWSLDRKRVIRDPAGFTVLTMLQKKLAMRQKWKVYRGNSLERNNLLFSAQESRVLQLKTSVDVNLGNNKKGSRDFHVSGSFTNLSFKVYKADALIAEATQRFSWRSFYKGKDVFNIKVNPEVDYAFIVALLIVIDDNEYS